jgi:predicted TIM-barrel fold metal-dependent hydrolase
MNIDGHVHVFLPDSRSYPRTVDTLAPKERSAPVEVLLATMQEAGVHGAVLVPLGPEDLYVAQCLARFPGRFVGICVADDEVCGRREGVRPEDALARRIEEGGFRGLRMNWLGDPSLPLVDSPACPTFRWMADHQVVLWFYGPAPQLGLLAEVAERYPDLSIVLNHLGFCPDAIGIDGYARPHVEMALPPPTLPVVIELARSPQVYVMFSGLYGFAKAEYPYGDLSDIVSEVYDAFGAERMLWASDFPWILERPGYKELLALPGLQGLEITARELESIHGRTAATIFKGAWQQ